MESNNQLFEYNQDSLIKIYPTLLEQRGEDRHLEKFMQQLPVGMEDLKMVDIGCGTGEMVRKLAALNPKSHVIGIDVSERFVNLARHTEPHMDNAKFYLMDMFNLEGIADNSVDFFLSSYSIHVKHPRDLIGLFKHIASKMKIGGKFKLLTNTIKGKDEASLPKAVEDNRVYQITLGKSSGKIWTLPQFGILQSELTDAMTEVGFQFVSIESFDRSEKMSDDYEFREKVAVVEVSIEAVLS